MRPLLAWLPFARPSRLRACGVLGINRRNLELIGPLNPREKFPRVDDKLLTKDICAENGVPVPATYCVLSRYGDLGDLAGLLRKHHDFVVKPNRGSGGRGVLVVVGRSGDAFDSIGRGQVTVPELRYHIATILAGLFSFGGHPDRALVEERVVCHPLLERVRTGGTPDIRIVVCRGTPVMSMIRLPTVESRGRANLHQGAVGAGIDLKTGRTTTAIHKGHAIANHPDTGELVTGVDVPEWASVLDIAVRAASALGLGYVGIDVVIDRTRGPLLIEANARPGLAIQIANGTGLLPLTATPSSGSRRSSPGS